MGQQVKQEDKNLAHDHISVQVFQLLEDIESGGQEIAPRGLKVREVQLAALDVNPIYPIMNFEPRKFNYKYFAGELAWYLKAQTSIDFINNFSGFWKNICPSGHANSNYGNLLFNPHPSTIDTDTGGINVNQLEWVYDSLIKDTNTRQAVAFFNSPFFQHPQNKDFVCTLYMNFWIRKNTLDMKVQMRSNDIFFGLTYDAPWFSAIMQSMYLNLKETYPALKLGYYYHSADNIHYYEKHGDQNHFELANNILDSTLDSSIGMTLKHPLFRFDQNRKIYISAEAKNFVDSLDAIVAKPEEFKKLKQADYKFLLEDLIAWS